MTRFQIVMLCLLSVFASRVHGQTPGIEPIHVEAGTVLTFHLQTRLNTSGGNVLDLLPKDTLLHVKMLDAIDSRVNEDGAEFRGSIVSAVVSGDQVVVHADAEVKGLLVILRSKSHPEGFRNELLITEVIDHGKSHALTASLNASFFDANPQPGLSSKAGNQ
jgi:hypothetical protein